MLDRIVTDLGGPKTLDRLRTLIVRGSIRNTSPSGQPLEARTTTYIAFPNQFRQDLETAFGTFRTVFSGGQAVLDGPKGRTVLSDSERRAFELSIARNPIAIAKARRHDLFSTKMMEADSGHGRPARLVVSLGPDEVAQLEVNRASGRIERLRYRFGTGQGDEKGIMVVELEDYRAVGGIRYPFRQRGSLDGKVQFEIRLDSVDVDPALDPDVFRLTERPSPARTAEP